MNFVIYMIVCIIVTAIIIAIGKRFITPLLMIKNKNKYMLLIILLGIFFGVLIICMVDVNRSPFAAGCCYGIMMGIMQVLVDFDK